MKREIPENQEPIESLLARIKTFIVYEPGGFLVIDLRESLESEPQIFALNWENLDFDRKWAHEKVIAALNSLRPEILIAQRATKFAFNFWVPSIEFFLERIPKGYALKRVLTEKGYANQLDKAVRKLQDERQKIEKEIEQYLNQALIKGNDPLFRTLWQRGS